MADSPFSWFEAKQQLENEMADRQRRLVQLLTGQHPYKSSAAEQDILENEIENRKTAFEQLSGQCSCTCCGTQVEVRETCFVHLTKYKENLPTMDGMVDKVRVRAECADCRNKYDSHKQPARVVATQDEIVRAIEALSPKQMRRLEKYAYWRVQGVGRASLGRTGEDLFQEALLSTCKGAKRWYKEHVDFFGHLRSAIRNIAFGWKQKRKQWEPFYLEADIIASNADGDEVSPLENVAGSDLAPDQYLSAKEEVKRIFKRFGNDKEVSAVLQAHLEGVTTAREIMQEHNLTKREYEGARRRIRSQKSALVIEEHDQVSQLLVRWLKPMEFAVVTARAGDEGLRLYGECGPFDVVILSYSTTVNGVQIATNIRKKNASQRVIITTTYSSEEDVVRPAELTHIPILLKPFGRNELRRVLESFANAVKEKPPNCFRPKRRRTGTLPLPLAKSRASRQAEAGRRLRFVEYGREESTPC